MDAKTQDEARASWLKFLNPDALKSNLIAGGLFLITYETLKETIIDRIRDFYSNSFVDGKWIASENYTTEVISKDKSVLRASLLWLKESKVIDEADMALVDRVCQFRNEVAHELMKFLATISKEIDVPMLTAMLELICKIERWWIREVEIPTNPDYDGEDASAIPDEEIQSGNMIFLGWIFQMVTDDETEARQRYRDLVDQLEKTEQRQRERVK